MRFHFVRHYIEKGVIELFYVPTALNIADIFTKALCTETFVGLKKFLLCNG